MKNILILLLAALLAVSLGACGGTDAPEESEPVGLANPWREVGAEEAALLGAGAFTLPEGAENAVWRVLGDGADAMVELRFDLDGLSFTARRQRTDDAQADISGLYYEWTDQMEQPFGGRDGAPVCRSFRHVGDDGAVDLCACYDPAAGVAYSLSTAGKDLDGFDLQAIAEQVFGV